MLIVFYPKGTKLSYSLSVKVAPKAVVNRKPSNLQQLTFEKAQISQQLVSDLYHREAKGVITIFYFKSWRRSSSQMTWKASRVYKSADQSIQNVRTVLVLKHLVFYRTEVYIYSHTKEKINNQALWSMTLLAEKLLSAKYT